MHIKDVFESDNDNVLFLFHFYYFIIIVLFLCFFIILFIFFATWNSGSHINRYLFAVSPKSCHEKHLSWLYLGLWRASRGVGEESGEGE